MNHPLPRIAITAGEPAGIGPDLCVMLAHKPIPAELVIIADEVVLHQRAELLGININITAPLDTVHQGNGSLTV
ncbi:MAG: 4-hydroxythreonine-4-phosphate dehydrogenase PdxA, partial [Methylophilaceae bacterium]|nr:4-hydroxythreonine-4-phosphate dehydrogenase PdxA [Methylophilaceae bacterium]